jgi:hypothetical protein
MNNKGNQQGELNEKNFSRLRPSKYEISGGKKNENSKEN